MSWAILLFLISFNSYADTELEPIEVEATKDIENFIFSSSEKISTRELENLPMGLAATALEKVPGLVANQNGGPGGRVSFFIRGTESRHVSYLLDGLKINDTSNTDRQFDAAFMTSHFVKELTVYKGPQAVLFGSDAIGGVVDIQTRKGNFAPETRFTLNAGSFGTVDSSLSKDWKSLNQNGTLTVSRFRTDGISRLNKKRFDASERDSADITQLTSSSEHRWANRIQTDFLASYLHGKAEQDGFGDDNSFDESQNDQYVLQQKTSYGVTENQSVSLRSGMNRHQRHNDSLASSSEFFNGSLFQHEFIHRLEKGPLSMISGVSTEKESAKSKGMDYSFDLHSVFLQSSMRFQKLKFHGGVRADKHSKYGSFYTGATGLNYADFSVQYSQGYKAPSLYQLFGPPSFGSPIGNPDLVPESNHSWEVSWKKNWELFQGGFALFQNRLSNQFSYSFTDGYANQQRFIAEGIEVHGKVKTVTFEVSSSFTHQQFRKEDDVVLKRPYNMGIVSFSYFPIESLEFNLTERWFSSRRDFGSTGIAKLNGYEVMDLGLRKTWEKDDVGVQLKNVLNREYEDVYGFSVIPRSVFAHYGHKF